MTLEFSQPSIARPDEPLRPIGVLNLEPEQLERSGVRFHPTAHDGLDTARAALVQIPDGRQFALLRYDHNPAPGVEVLSSENSSNIADDLSAILDALGLSNDVVSWSLDPAVADFERSLEPPIFLELGNPFSTVRENVTEVARSLRKSLGVDRVGVVSRKELAFGVSPVDTIYVWPRDSENDAEVARAIEELTRWAEQFWTSQQRAHPEETPRAISIVGLNAAGRATRSVRIDAPDGRARADAYDETGLPPRPRPEWHGWET